VTERSNALVDAIGRAKNWRVLARKYVNPPRRWSNPGSGLPISTWLWRSPKSDN